MNRLVKKEYPSKKWRCATGYEGIGLTVLKEKSFVTEWVLFGSSTSTFTPTEQVNAVINGIDGLDYNAPNPLYYKGGTKKEELAAARASTPQRIHSLVYKNTTNPSNTRSNKRFKADPSSSEMHSNNKLARQ